MQFSHWGLINIFRRNIKYKLFLVYLLVISMPIVAFGIISYRLSADVVQSDYIKYKEGINRQIIKTLDENIGNLERQSMAVYTSLDEILYVLDTPTDKLDTKYIEEYRKVYNSLVSIIQGNTQLYGITLISMNGEIKFYYDRNVGNPNLYSVKNEGWFKETLKNKGLPLLRGPHYNEFSMEKKMVVSVSRAIINLNNDNISGVLLFDQDINQFSDMFTNAVIEKGEIITVFGNNKNLVYSNVSISENVITNLLKSLENKNSSPFYYNLNGVRMLTNFSNSTKTGWTVITFTPVVNLQEKSEFLGNINILLISLLMVLTFMISILVSYFITKPLKKLMSSFRKLQKGDFTTSVSVKGEDELAQIGTTFNNMVANIKSLIEQKYEANILRKQAELESLQSQINPHFLFNTLNSIKAVSENREHEKTSVMIQNLSDIFRYCLNKGAYIVKFSEELDHIRKYLSLQELRFSDRYSVKYDIDVDVLSLEIPRMTLQPIVENAIYHGLEPDDKHGELQITAKNINHKFFIYISNTGKGINENDLIYINSLLKEDPDQFHCHIPGKMGVYNVNARIKLQFGNQYGLKISSYPGSNTTVKITLPANRHSAR